MPEYIMPGRTAEFTKLPEFTRGYIEAAFFTSAGGAGDELYEAGFTDLAPETLAGIQSECDAFAGANADALAEACEIGDDYDMVRAGRDFWFTRNGHGVGFWDRGLGAVGETLSAAARRCGERDLYLGDDGRVRQ